MSGHLSRPPVTRRREKLHGQQPPSDQNPRVLIPSSFLVRTLQALAINTPKFPIFSLSTARGGKQQQQLLPKAKPAKFPNPLHSPVSSASSSSPIIIPSTTTHIYQNRILSPSPTNLILFLNRIMPRFSISLAFFRVKGTDFRSPAVRSVPRVCDSYLPV
jgi:hypothetical protein